MRPEGDDLGGDPHLRSRVPPQQGGHPEQERRPPFGLAYLDLDDGPRVLVHLADAAIVAPGTRLRITGTDRDDLVAAPEERP